MIAPRCLVWLLLVWHSLSHCGVLAQEQCDTDNAGVCLDPSQKVANEQVEQAEDALPQDSVNEKVVENDRDKVEDVGHAQRSEEEEEVTAAAADADASVAKQEPLECGLYMAPSSIPNSGWGMYTAKPLAKGDAIHPLDVVIQVPDYDKQMKFRATYDTKLPKWLLNEYYWNPEFTGGFFDAKKVASIVPGLGMLANSHTGSVNTFHAGPKYKQVVERSDPAAGAYSEYKDETFVATQDIPVGHELMVEYGDFWFEERSQNLGEDIPLSTDFKTADEVLQKIETFCDGKFDTDFCRDLWQLVRHDVSIAASPRLMNALPERLEQVKDVLITGTARHSVPDIIRSVAWLQENGMCLDHIEPHDSSIPRAGSGAFSTRALPKGTVVAPAPVVHMHRGHMDIFFVDRYDKEQVHWKGHQLLLNYLYGHPSTSLVFFPYSPVVNLINHSPEPNVELRWSERMGHPEYMNFTTEELVKANKGAGLMMEIVALRDIRDGEEIVINYGTDWQEAWEKHLKTWRKPLDSDTHEAVEWIRNKKVLPTQEDDDESLPRHAMTVCWVDFENAEETEYEDEVIWERTSVGDLAEAYQCHLVSRDTSGKKDLYEAQVEVDSKIHSVVEMPRKAIQVVDRPYTGNQFLRQSFRHEIRLPDHMIPDHWKDKEVVDESCGLYMAESAIPNSGLGMYTAKAIVEGHDITFPDIVIQAEDPDGNHQLRRWYVGQDEFSEPDWMIDHYYWNPHFAAGNYEASDVQSIVPGAGMLANSHTGVINADTRRPHIDSAGLTRKRDPGVGAFSNFHGMRFVAYNGDIAPGSEIYVEYGDGWFEEHEERLGMIPLSSDYRDADVMLLDFWEVIGGDPDTEMAKDLWELLWSASSTAEKSRVRNALPRNLSDVESVLDVGTAAYSVRDSVRSTEWLEKNGRCLDNIKPGMSRIPQAGRGAFATRHIAKGQVIAPAPVVQLDEDQMVVLDSENPQDPESPIWIDGEQLLKNYCYGHKNSTLLLFPYSPIVNYINHDHENFNAELQWSSLPNHKSDWLNRSVAELLWEDGTGLIMEFVATRDIAPNEEILIDYGSRWQQAWDEHVRTWKRKPSDRYIPAWQFNDYTLPVRTQTEQVDDPYPKNVYTQCYVPEDIDRKQPGSIVDGKLEYKWEYRRGMYHRTRATSRCDVLARYQDYKETADSIRPVDEKYKVRLYRKKQLAWVVTNVPRRAIEFFDKEYKSDLALRTAFRHEIGLPDHMLPSAWNDDIEDN